MERNNYRRIWISILLSVTTLGLGLSKMMPAQAADIVCRGVMFGDTDFEAFHGETGFGRIELTYRVNGRTVPIPLQYLEIDSQGNAVFRGNNPESPSDVAEVISPRTVQPGTTIQAVYNGNSFPGNCSSNSSGQPPTGDPIPPKQGTWQGRGTATNPVFRTNQPVDATLNYNSTNRFSIDFYAPPGTGARVYYLGIITQLTSTGANPNSFRVEGRVESFATSANGSRVDSAMGDCRIEIADARIVDAYCSTNLPGSTTDFSGRSQF